MVHFPVRKLLVYQAGYLLFVCAYFFNSLHPMAHHTGLIGTRPGKRANQKRTGKIHHFLFMGKIQLFRLGPWLP